MTSAGGLTSKGAITRIIQATHTSEARPTRFWVDIHLNKGERMTKYRVTTNHGHDAGSHEGTFYHVFPVGTVVEKLEGGDEAAWGDESFGLCYDYASVDSGVDIDGDDFPVGHTQYLPDEYLEEIAE
jgi:hypothetical protein